MPMFQSLKDRLRRFSRDECGTVMVEVVLTLPILFLGVAVTYEFYEIHRYNSARDKATYTVADMISREMAPVNDTYIDNTKALFDSVSNDSAPTQIRVTVIKYDADQDQYSVAWSAVRGTGNMPVLTTDLVRDRHSELPNMGDGEEIILVESESDYQPVFDVGFGDGVSVVTRMITSPRFAPQVVWDS